MDVKAVQKALNCHVNMGDCALECPFDRKDKCISCIIKAAYEVITPCVLSLDEIHRGMAVWIEYKEKPSWLAGFGDKANDKPVTLAIGGSECGGARCFIDEFDRSFAANDTDYNVRWRAWTQEPDEEQRKAVKWNA